MRVICRCRVGLADGYAIGSVIGYDSDGIRRNEVYVAAVIRHTVNTAAHVGLGLGCSRHFPGSRTPLPGNPHRCNEVRAEKPTGICN